MFLIFWLRPFLPTTKTFCDSIISNLKHCDLNFVCPKSYCQMSTMPWINWLFVLKWQQQQEHRVEKINNQMMACILTFSLKVWTFYQCTVDNDFMQSSLSYTLPCQRYLWKFYLHFYMDVYLGYVEPNVYSPYPVFHFVVNCLFFFFHF